MIWHPLVWAFWAAAATGGVLYAIGTMRALDVMLNWSPGCAGMNQLRRERRAESAALLGHWALGCLTAAAVLGLAGVAVVWHRSVPGAMCGTGVLQALGTDGSRAMVFWGVGLSVLYAWRILDRLDEHQPAGVLTRTKARVMVGAAPFIGLAMFYAWQGLMRIESVPAVSCCAAVYDRVLDVSPTSTDMKRLVSVCLWGSLAGGTALLALAMATIRHPLRESGLLAILIAIPWAIASTTAVKWVWSAYYFQVLSHPCPWCLFLADYFWAGFFIFGSMAVVVVEGMALDLATRTHRRHPVLAAPAIRRRRQAAWRITASLIAHTSLTAAPAIFWWLQSGLWLHGGH